MGLHDDGKGDEETRAVVEVSEKGGRALTHSKQGTENTGTREEKVGIDGQTRGRGPTVKGCVLAFTTRDCCSLLGLGFPFVQTWGRGFPSLRGTVRIVVVQKTTRAAVSMCPNPTLSGMVALGRRVCGGEWESLQLRQSFLWLTTPSGRLRF